MKDTIKAAAHIGLYIKDIERSKKFYSEILGFECVCEFVNDTDDKLSFMKSGELVIELIQHKVWMDRHDGLFDHIAMLIDDIEETILGFECVCEFENEKGDKLSFIKSGDLVIELIQHKVWMDRHDGLFDHVAMLVDDIEETSRELAEKGIKFEEDIYFESRVFEKGVKYQAFRGPDGEHLEIYEIVK